MHFSKIFCRTGLWFLAFAGALFSTSSYALSCKEAGSNSVKQVISLDHQIDVSTANLKPGTVLWRSQSFSSTFRCEDTNGYPQGEDAWLYWDPASQMQTIHNSLEVGVTYQSVDIKPVKGDKTNVGPGTACRPGGRWNRCQSPARPLTITVNYSVYIKATGNPPPSNGKINNSGEYAIFQVDGELGLNNTPNSNFRAYISGLGNIRFISCNPTITVVANNGSTVDFGRIPARNAVIGKTEKQIPFTIQANLTGAGQDCQGKTLMASFSTTYPTEEGTTILPTSDSGFGILISTVASPDAFIPMNTPTELGYINGSVVENNYLASLKWLSTKPKIGTFSASANVDVTFK